jgi:hypothetical protein
MTIEACEDLGNWFRSVVSSAMRRRGVEAEPETTEYVSGLLVHCAGSGARDFLDQPMAQVLHEALDCAPGMRLVRLQRVGDGSLCLAGLFGSHVEASQLDPGYYVTLGRFAYREAAALARSHGGEPVALQELGEQFPRFVDVLSEVAEGAALGSVARSVVQLYDRFKRGGSQKALEELARRGVFPGRPGEGSC